MLTQRLYYFAKPFLPWRVKMALRRIAARPRRMACQSTWPIDESAAQVPEGWPGWPNGKRFSVVLTHDVEGPEGLEKIQRIAEIEMSLGFRSSFNLIPEGPYTVPPGLRTWLTERGFEVGVHDLHHDGKLFLSRQGFARKAGRINWYLRDWGAAGFRSGFMLRNLEWIHDLDVRYDASTFDTDPFEFQSEGARTIFPFWVSAPAPKIPDRSSREQSAAPDADSRASAQAKARVGADGSPSHDSVEDTWGVARSPQARDMTTSPFPLPPIHAGPAPHRGYVELPYTLPQDSTLFLLFRERGPEIWLRKLDWIAGHGGMALVNVHPDYVRFHGERASPRTFPVGFYVDLLNHIRTRHAGAFWGATAREVAAHGTPSTAAVS